MNTVSVVKTSPGRDGGQTTTEKTYEESLAQYPAVQIGEKQTERSSTPSLPGIRLGEPHVPLGATPPERWRSRSLVAKARQTARNGLVLVD